jgi:hypothetical protein
VIVLATDAPLSERQLGRLALRATLGLGRAGSIGANARGVYALAFDTAGRIAHRDPRHHGGGGQRDDANFAAGHGGMTFEQVYGTNASGKNAFGKCVSGKAKAASKADVKATVNAAKTCKDLKKNDPAAYAKYGTGRTAFGKCVSATAKAKNDEAAA